MSKLGLSNKQYTKLVTDILIIKDGNLDKQISKDMWTLINQFEGLLRVLDNNITVTKHGQKITFTLTDAD